MLLLVVQLLPLFQLLTLLLLMVLLLMSVGQTVVLGLALTNGVIQNVMQLEFAGKNALRHLREMLLLEAQLLLL
jgi:hypothetical protein